MQTWKIFYKTTPFSCQIIETSSLDYKSNVFTATILGGVTPSKPTGKCNLNVSCPHSFEIRCFLTFDTFRNDHKMVR